MKGRRIVSGTMELTVGMNGAGESPVSRCRIDPSKVEQSLTRNQVEQSLERIQSLERFLMTHPTRDLSVTVRRA